MRSLVVLALLALPRIATALPPLQSANDTEDDATIHLQVRESMILRDTKSLCSVRIVVDAQQVAFAAGDSATVWVYEDDAPIGDDLLFTTQFTLDAAEVVAQRLDRTFDCSGPFGDDPGSAAEIYATAKVDLDACGTFCFDDSPTTSNLSVQEVDTDDSHEPDDSSTTGGPLTEGVLFEAVLEDDDWYVLVLNDPATIDIELSYTPSTGRIDAMLTDSGTSQIALVTDNQNGGLITAGPLAAGTYFLRSGLRTIDYNFYDVRWTASTMGCLPDAVESQDCGNCGRRTRTCDQNGTWSAFGPCENEGSCSPGETESRPCAGEGTMTRACGQDCRWGAYSSCTGGACTGTETEVCYEGPAGTEGEGICVGGTRQCDNGFWGPCNGQQLPQLEDCSDNQDNDCDGVTDGQDDDCLGEFGGPCGANTTCGGGLDCVREPGNPMFVEGYCGRVGCTTANDCPTGGLCESLFAQRYCLNPCTSPNECRTGYLCYTLSGGTACIPKCRSNADCRDPNKPQCDPIAFVCTAAGPVPDAGVIDTGAAPLVDSGVTNWGTSPPEAEAGCGCSHTQEDSRSLILAISVALFGLVRRRSR